MDWAYFGDNNVYYLRNQPELFQGNRARLRFSGGVYSHTDGVCHACILGNLSFLQV